MAENLAKKVLAPKVDISLPCEIDGAIGRKVFQLAYDFRAICAIKAKTGVSILDPKVWMNAEKEPELLATVLWGGLQLVQPELTLEDVQAMMFPTDFSLILEKILEAWTHSSPKANAADPKPEPVAEPALTQ